MRGFRFSLILFIIAIGFAFQPGSAWGYTLGDAIDVKPYFPEDPVKKDETVPTERFHVYCSNIWTGVLMNCETELQLREKDPFFVDDPAGHEHNGDRPVGKMKKVDDGQEGLYLHFDTFDTIGEVVYIDYLVPEVSGDYVVDWSYKFWWPDSQVFVSSAFWFRVREEGFAELSASGDHHIVVRNLKETHPRGNWGRAEVREKMWKLSELYYEKFNRRLSINDMSLKRGGLFDYSADWKKPHKWHRKGRSIDINHWDEGGYQVDEGWLDDIALEYDCKRHEAPILVNPSDPTNPDGRIHYECI